jgi:hypothetical protein
MRGADERVRLIFYRLPLQEPTNRHGNVAYRDEIVMFFSLELAFFTSLISQLFQAYKTQFHLKTSGFWQQQVIAFKKPSR